MISSVWLDFFMPNESVIMGLQIQIFLCNRSSSLSNQVVRHQVGIFSSFFGLSISSVHLEHRRVQQQQTVY